MNQNLQYLSAALPMGSVRPQLVDGEFIPRHYHALPYAAIILEGGYEEAGESGRWRVIAGDVVVHAPFSAHRNYSAHGARVVNLPIPPYAGESQCGCIDDPERIARLAARDPIEALIEMTERWRTTTSGPIDEADVLASVLKEPNPPSIEAWSAQSGYSRHTVFRHFRAAYGVGPNRYRVEARARRAWRMIVMGLGTLAEIAATAGFADQAHLQRDVKALTGRTPAAWRRFAAMQHSFNTPETATRQHWSCVAFNRGIANP